MPKATKSKKEAAKAKADKKGDDEKKKEEAKEDEVAAADTSKEEKEAKDEEAPKDTPSVEDANPKADGEAAAAANDRKDGTVDSEEKEKGEAGDKKEESDAKEVKKEGAEKEKDEGKEEEVGDVEMKDAATKEDAEKEAKEDEHEEGDSKKKKRKTSSSKEPQEPAVKRERRDRKSANTFTPDDFTHVDKSVKQKPGRGKPLGELEIVKHSIESSPMTSNDLLQAHRLIYMMRGKPPKKELKSNLLKFSGYLPEKDSSLDAEAQDEVDEEEEKKMGARAYKLPVPQIKSILDFLKVDRKGVSTKDDLVDLLLDFLGEPDESYLVGSKKSSDKKKSKSDKKKRAKDDEGDEEDGEEKDHKEKKSTSGDDYSDVGDERVEEGHPSDEMLRRWVRAYVRCHNMKKSTVKSALELASDKFGVDLSDKKQRFKELLTEEM